MENAALNNKRVLLGITGSIAAYKSAVLLRDLQRAGAEVKVLMTQSARAFVNPLTFSTLSGNEVYTEIIDDDNNWNNHVELGLWADVMLIAPLTANSLAKMCAGICDNILLASYLSADCPVVLAPAMDRDMYKHPATQDNLSLIEKRGNSIIPAEYGALASGLVGEGRMAEPTSICTYLSEHVFPLEEGLKLSQMRVLVTAGPTYEDIDPVRFIGNRSTGKMGIAIAEACAEHGATVTLILGPTSQTVENDNIQVLRVQNAQEMYEKSVEHFPEMDAAFMVAAVSDYRPKDTATEKIKKSDGPMKIEFVRNPDIALKLGKLKKKEQFLAGFALETQNGIEYAREKRAEKNFDFIVLNSLKEKGAGFAHNTNKVTIVTENEATLDLPLMSKRKVADKIVQQFIKMKNL